MYKFPLVLIFSILFAYVLAWPLGEQQHMQQQQQQFQQLQQHQQQQQSSSSSSSSSSSLSSASATGTTTTTTPATIIKQVDITNPDGSYNSSYETSNGIRVENAGFMKRIIVPKTETTDGQVIEEHEEMILVQQGSYSYSDPDGNVITLRYVADENGFQPQGDHLPTPPS